MARWVYRYNLLYAQFVFIVRSLSTKLSARRKELTKYISQYDNRDPGLPPAVAMLRLIKGYWMLKRYVYVNVSRQIL